MCRSRSLFIQFLFISRSFCRSQRFHYSSGRKTHRKCNAMLLYGKSRENAFFVASLVLHYYFMQLDSVELHCVWEKRFRYSWFWSGDASGFSVHTRTQCVLHIAANMRYHRLYSSKRLISRYSINFLSSLRDECVFRWVFMLLRSSPVFHYFPH